MILRGLSASFFFPTQGARCAAWRGVTRPNRISRMAGRSPPWQRLSENSPARPGPACSLNVIPGLRLCVSAAAIRSEAPSAVHRRQRRPHGKLGRAGPDRSVPGEGGGGHISPGHEHAGRMQPPPRGLGGRVEAVSICPIMGSI